MRAVALTQIGSTDFATELKDFTGCEELDTEIQEEEVKIKFLAGSLNHSDLWVALGAIRHNFQFPHVVGADCCAKVIESKSGKFKVDDRVLLYPGVNLESDEWQKNNHEKLDFCIRGENAQGVFREKWIVHESELERVPDYLTNEEAGALPIAWLTAWQMATVKGCRDIGESPHAIEPVLVHGIGSGVSQALVQLLWTLGVSKIYATSRNREKLVPWESRGFRCFYGSPPTDLYENLKKEVPGGFGVIFDHIGQDYFEMNLKLLRNGGRIVTCGATSGGDINKKRLLHHIFARQLSIIGGSMGSREHFKELVIWLGACAHTDQFLRPGISNVIPWSEAKRAYRIMESGGQNGKIVLVP